MDSQKQFKEKIYDQQEAKNVAKETIKDRGKVKSQTDQSLTQLCNIETCEIKEKQKISTSNSEIKTTSSSVPMHKNESLKENLFLEQKFKTSIKYKMEQIVENKKKIEEKSKVELKNERRVKQESQRAAKQAFIIDKKKLEKNITEKIQEKVITSINIKPVTKTTIKYENKDNLHEVNLFKHLYINKRNIYELIKSSTFHPAILKLGVQYSEKIIVGSNARCVALLSAIKQFIEDFERPSQADFTRGLEANLQESLNYLNFCRPSAVSMQNAVKHLKRQMSILPSTMADKEAKLKLGDSINTYIQEQILLADKAISNAIQKKILNGDVILTYGFSSLIHKILCNAYTVGKQFRVIIVDARPWLEGRELLKRLIKHGIDCSYVLINALSFIMPQVSKVFLGAHAILANGAVMSRAGTSQIALIANAFNVPVLVACETHKSCERVQTDSIVYNEIGNPNKLVTNMYNNSIKSCLLNWKTKKMLNLLNITYDVTPAYLVTAVVTELAILPCTSVPVILRIKPSEI